jgi:hypothetical protein
MVYFPYSMFNVGRSMFKTTGWNFAGLRRLNPAYTAYRQDMTVRLISYLSGLTSG